MTATQQQPLRRVQKLSKHHEDMSHIVTARYLLGDAPVRFQFVANAS
jgi:hypothetical protein